MSSNASPQTTEGQGSSEIEYLTTVATNSSAVNPLATTASPSVSTETLMARLRSQVEFYFSQQNLSRDTYLRNLLSQYGGATVPLSVICNFPKVQNICISFNVPVDPHLVMRALEGSTVVYVTPDATWISPVLPLPPLDPNVKQRPVPLGPRSLSVSSVPDMGARPSAPNSPVKSANEPVQQAQLPGSLNNVTGSPTRPAMIDRSQSHSGPVHYAPSMPVSHPIPHGIPVSAPGYPQTTYGYPFRNMPPPPGNYAQAGYMYAPMQGHPPLSGVTAMQYAQIYPGYTYVGTTVTNGPHKYFHPGNPVAIRSNTANANRPAPYDGGQKRSTQQNNGGGVRNNKSDNLKQNRKVRNRKGVNEQTAANTGNMTRRGSKEQLKQVENAISNVNKESTKMTRNRSQNDMSDSSGGAQTTRRKNKNKNQTDENIDRREDVTFDANHFPALTPSSPVKEKGPTEKPPTVAISGYAAALLAKNKVPSNQEESNGTKKEVTSSADPHNVDLVSGVTDINLNTGETRDVVTDKIEGDSDASAAAGLSSVNDRKVSDGTNKSPTKASGGSVEKVKKGAKAPVMTEAKSVQNGPSSNDAKDGSVVERKVESAPAVHHVTPASDKKSSSPSAPVPTWGNKLSFIDVVRKQV